MTKRMRKYLTALIGLILSSCSNGQTTVAENGIEISNYGITEKQSELLFENTKSFPNNTQLAVALIKNGKIDFIGIERRNDTIKLIENYKNAFEIGSITKVFTATLLSNFVTEQKLKLEDNIQDYLDFKIKSENRITFKELANHTSGLPRLPTNLNLLLVDQDNPYKDYDEEKLISYLMKEVELNQEPGIKYEYSNLGAGILGFELATISKSSYESLLQEKIFTKFKMVNSTSRRENVKTKLVNGLKPNGKTTSNWEFSVLAGAGAIYSTVEDLSQFAISQFDYSNKELKLTRVKSFELNENMDIGLGWHILKSQSENIWYWHNGGTGGYSSSMVIEEKSKNGIIILSNVSAFNPNMGNIDRLCFELMKTLEKE